MAIDNIYYLDDFNRSITRTNSDKSITTVIESIASLEATEFFSLQVSSTHFYLFGTLDTVLRRAFTDAPGSWVTILDTASQTALLSVSAGYTIYWLEALERKTRAPIVSLNDNVYIAYIARDNVVTETYILRYNGTSWSKLLTLPSEEFFGWADLNYENSLIGLKTVITDEVKYYNVWKSSDVQVHINCNKLRILNGATVTVIPAPTNLQRPAITATHEIELVDLPAGANAGQLAGGFRKLANGDLIGILPSGIAAPGYIFKLNPTTLAYSAQILPAKFGSTVGYINSIVTVGNLIVICYVDNASGVNYKLFDLYDGVTLTSTHLNIYTPNIDKLSHIDLTPTISNQIVITFISDIDSFGHSLDSIVLDASAGTFSVDASPTPVNVIGCIINYKAVLANGNIVYGPLGIDGGTPGNSLYIYEIATRTWISQVGVLTQAHYFPGTMAIVDPGNPWDDFIIINGQYGPQAYTIYDPHTQTVVFEPTILNQYNMNYATNFSLSFPDFENSTILSGTMLYAISGPDNQYIRIIDLVAGTMTIKPTQLNPDDDISRMIGWATHAILKDANTISTLQTYPKQVDAIGTMGQILYTYDVSLNTTVPTVSLANIQAVTAVSETEVYCATIAASNANIVGVANKHLAPEYGYSPNSKLIIYKWNGTTWTNIHEIDDPAYLWVTGTGSGGEFGTDISMPYTPLLMSHRYVNTDLELVMFRDTPESVYVYNVGTNTLTVAALKEQLNADNQYKSETSPSIPYVYNKMLSTSVSQSYRSGYGLRNEIDVYAEARFGYNLTHDVYWVDRNKQPIFVLKSAFAYNYYVGKSQTYYINFPINSDLPLALSITPQLPLPTGITVAIDSADKTGILCRVTIDNTATLGYNTITFNVAPFSQPSTALNASTDLYLQVYESAGSGLIPGGGSSGTYKTIGSNLYVYGSSYDPGCYSPDGLTWTILPVTNTQICDSTTTWIDAIYDICDTPSGLLFAVGAGLQRLGQYFSNVSFAVTDSTATLSPSALPAWNRNIRNIVYDGHRYICIALLENNSSIINTSVDLVSWGTPEYATSGLGVEIPSTNVCALEYSNGTTLACLGHASIKRIVASTGVMQNITNVSASVITGQPKLASDGAGNWLMCDAFGVNAILSVSSDDGLTWTEISVYSLGGTSTNRIMSVVCKSGFFFAILRDDMTNIMMVKRSTSILFDINLQSYTTTVASNFTGVAVLGNNLVALNNGNTVDLVKISADNGATWA